MKLKPFLTLVTVTLIVHVKTAPVHKQALAGQSATSIETHPFLVKALDSTHFERVSGVGVEKRQAIKGTRDPHHSNGFTSVDQTRSENDDVGVPGVASLDMVGSSPFDVLADVAASLTSRASSSSPIGEHLLPPVAIQADAPASLVSVPVTSAAAIEQDVTPIAVPRTTRPYRRRQVTIFETPEFSLRSEHGQGLVAGETPLSTREASRQTKLQKDREYGLRYYQQNRPTLLEKAKVWRHENKPKVKERNHKHYTKNKDLSFLRTAKWRSENPERTREVAKSWRDKNKDKIQGYKRKAYERKKALRVAQEQETPASTSQATTSKGTKQKARGSASKRGKQKAVEARSEPEEVQAVPAVAVEPFEPGPVSPARVQEMAQQAQPQRVADRLQREEEVEREVRPRYVPDLNLSPPPED